MSASDSPSLKRKKSNVPNTITFVTSNKNKLSELQNILKAGEQNLPFEIVSQNVDLPELQGRNPKEVAIEKCRLASLQVGSAVMTEDTSLCFNSLQGLPGIYIKWFLEAIGHEGLNNLLAAYPDKSAFALCIFAYCPGPGEPIIAFEGRTDGKIVPARAPAEYFGWDPIFEPDGFNQTYAEMEKSVKNTISHRYRALDKLRSYLLDQIGPSDVKTESEEL
eukprot:CAMPEP_0182419786 /NCGR_PEP_ID=MMETSP1167-20130531/4156_1 /TAXON_ID=2988 /ORGANISM="Mallomonas Sp, Strain CCMP3275" /LENGTH=219 /DNA_ID=CAMNT_0024594879 /DNA_START=129 /DNA_END=788 /DNA_ORIENTATION=+